MEELESEYVIVGSGAGGGTLAARLAEAGRTVTLLEAGDDVKRLAEEGAARLPEDYDVPAFHPFASENPAMAWNFYVRHYASDERSRTDPKFVAAEDGVLYPRAGTLGGCTAHNAMILTYPHEADWDGIAELTGDRSWRARRMRRYFVRLEACCHRPVLRFLARLGINPTRHGWNGWLTSERAVPLAALEDSGMRRVVLHYVLAATGEPWLKRLLRFLRGRGDPNARWPGIRDPEGVVYAPLTTRDHARTGTRERLLDVAARHPDRLRIVLNALAGRVLFDGMRAVGVEYARGARLYRTHPDPSPGDGARRVARATREVILCGGAFNTPQLLMLSGIGPAGTLARHGIGMRVDLPGVGRNLQDRYEVSVVNRMKFAAWPSLAAARFDRTDPLYREWAECRDGMYITNGAGLAVILRSLRRGRPPDLFCMPFFARFQGYFPGYAKEIAAHRNYLSWTILKAHTRNRAGEVTLRSADPRDPPLVNFRYFEEGDDASGDDLASVVEGVKFARRMIGQGTDADEILPGPEVQSDAALADYVRRHAWGHHASCSCAIGPRAQGGVLDSAFRVHGTTALRVVDASVFPRIPGFFIAAAIYMIAEKAADAILADVGDGSTVSAAAPGMAPGMAVQEERP